MSISITLRQTRTVISEEVFRVQTEVLTATEIIPQVFVLRTSDDEFQHVALVDELVSLPQSKQAALDALEEQYLSDTATVDYLEVATAVSAATHVRDRVQHLVTMYEEYTETFEGTDDYTITPGND